MARDRKTTPATPSRKIEGREDDAQQMHRLLRKMRRPEDLRPNERKLLVGLGQRQLEKIAEARIKDFVKTVLDPLVIKDPRSDEEKAGAVAYLEQPALVLPQPRPAFPTLFDLYLEPGTYSVHVPWSKGDPNPEEKARTVRSDGASGLFHSLVAEGKVAPTGRGEISLGVGAGSSLDEEYPAQKQYWIFTGAESQARLTLLHFFPFPASNSPLQVTATVRIDAWRKNRSPLLLFAAPYGVTGAVADATLSVAGPTANPPSQVIVRRRFIQAGSNTSDTDSMLDPVFELSGTIVLAPEAHYVCVTLQILIISLYLAGDNQTGLAVVNLVREDGPALFHLTMGAGPIQVAPVQLILKWL
jgi:hypothetical protein